MLVKTNELSGIALDWAVAKCEGVKTEVINPHAIDRMFLGCYDNTDFAGNYDLIVYNPSTDWAQGGAIIDKYSIEVVRGLDAYLAFANTYWYPNGTEHRNMFSSIGASYLEAAMRCYVASKLGEEVDIPEELLK